MNEVDFVTCDIALSGDTRMIVPRKAHNPVSWMEIPVLRSMHGDHAIRNIKFLETRDMPEATQLDIIRNSYKKEDVQAAMGMMNGRLPPTMPEEMRNKRRKVPNVESEEMQELRAQVAKERAEMKATLEEAKKKTKEKKPLTANQKRALEKARAAAAKKRERELAKKIAAEEQAKANEQLGLELPDIPEALQRT